MPDILIRHVDEELAERIKALARERNCSVNDMVVSLLRRRLDMPDGELPFVKLADITYLGGAWDNSESQALKDAMLAMDRVPEGFFAHIDDQNREE